MRASRGSRRARAALLWVLPLVTAAIVWGSDPAPRDRHASARSGATFGGPPIAVERVVRERFVAACRAARAVARAALDGPIYAAPEAIGPLRGRLEGLEVLDEQPDRPLQWWGSPIDLASLDLDADTPGFHLVRRGSEVRLLAVAGPDSIGRRVVASLRIDSASPELAFEALLPDWVSTMAEIRVRPLDDGTAEARSDTSIPLAAPDGVTIGTCRVAPVLAPAAALDGARAITVGILTFAVLLAAIGRPRARARNSLAGLAVVVAAIAGLRLALSWTQATSAWLPPPLGEAIAYGASGALGLARSPGDFLLSGVAIFLVSRATLTRARGAARSSRRSVISTRLSAAVVALGCIAAVGWAAGSIARNSRAVLVGPEADGGAAGLTLLVGLAFGVVAVAEAIASVALTFRRRSPSAGVASRLTAVVLVPVAAIASGKLLLDADRIALERLRFEYAPEVLERSDLRRVAVRAAVDRAAEKLATSDIDLEDPNLAYDLWTGSVLARRGLQSSLTVQRGTGETLAHFGFDLPLLDEPHVGEDAAAPLDPFREEQVGRIDTARRRLVHYERTVRAADGTVEAHVVGHVVDEPDNLPFLPGSRAYLTSLGLRPDTSRPAPEYVAYRPDGAVSLHTLGQPPAWTYALDKAALEERSLRLSTGGTPYVALPLVETSRLHLLLYPASTWLGYVGVVVRIALAALAIVALAALASRAFGRGGLASVARDLGRSLYGKLVTTLLAASVVPWLVLTFGLRVEFEARAEQLEDDAAKQVALVAKRAVEDFASAQTGPSASEPLPDDAVLAWLRRIVRQDILLYADARLLATSKRELVDAGLVSSRLASEVHFEINQSNRPVFVRRERVGGQVFPVAYAPVRVPGEGWRAVVAVPLVQHRPEVARALERNLEIVLLASVLLAGVLAASSLPIARAVAGPIRGLALATGRLARGDYGVRLETRSKDEVAELVDGFNAMSAALEAQRDDLVRRREYVEALVRYATTGVVSIDRDGVIVTINPTASGLIGPADDPPVPGRRLVAALERRPAFAPFAGELVGAPNTSRPRDDVRSREVNLVEDDGPKRIRFVVVPLPDPSGDASGRLVLIEDVTDLMRRNQLEAWAEMARAIAHEIKNPLTPIQLSTEHLRRLLADRGVLPAEPVEACLTAIERQVGELRQIATEFSQYARVPAIRPEPVDPVAFLRETLAPYRAASPPSIEIEESYRPCPDVAVDRPVFARAIVNLVENALQAMPEGGRLRVSAAPAGNHAVEIRVADTGVGLSDEARERLFEPYFSTKSSGTGLGLAIVRRTVEGHGGSIAVETTGEGTLFTIRLRPSRRGPSHPDDRGVE